MATEPSVWTKVSRTLDLAPSSILEVLLPVLGGGLIVLSVLILFHAQIRRLLERTVYIRLPGLSLLAHPAPRRREASTTGGRSTECSNPPDMAQPSVEDSEDPMQ